jgi:hypothetical protein
MIELKEMYVGKWRRERRQIVGINQPVGRVGKLL